MRLGTYYRQKCFARIFGNFHGRNALDLGGFDGYFLHNLKFVTREVLDIRVNKKYHQIIYKIGTYKDLKGKKTRYDLVLFMDVLQYIADPKDLFITVSKILQNGGSLILSVPHPKMEIFPRFMSVWLHGKWGEFVKIGYTVPQIKTNLPLSLKIKQSVLVREQYFRLFYFPLRLIWGINQTLGKIIIDKLLLLERQNFTGPRGHIYIRIVKR